MRCNAAFLVLHDIQRNPGCHKVCCYIEIEIRYILLLLLKSGGKLKFRPCAILLVPNADNDLAPRLALLNQTEALCEPFEREDLGVDDGLDSACGEQPMRRQGQDGWYRGNRSAYASSSFQATKMRLGSLTGKK